MRRRGFVIYSDDHTSKKSTKSNNNYNNKHFRLPSVNGDNNNKDIPLSQLTCSLNKKSSKKTSTSKVVNMSVFMNSLAENNVNRNEFTTKASTIAGIADLANENYSRYKILTSNHSSLTNILESSNIDKREFSNQNDRSYLEYLRKQNSQSPVVLSERSMVIHLQNSLWKFNSKLKLLLMSNEKSFDMIMDIRILHKISSNELLLTTTDDNLPIFILHHPKNHDKLGTFIISNSYRIVLNSKSIIKLNERLSWCLNWKLIQKI